MGEVYIWRGNIYDRRKVLVGQTQAGTLYEAFGNCPFGHSQADGILGPNKVGTYENGIIYDGTGAFCGSAIGSYEDGIVYSGTGFGKKIIGAYRNGEIFEPDSLYGRGALIGEYSGSPAGAAALLLGMFPDAEYSYKPQNAGTSHGADTSYSRPVSTRKTAVRAFYKTEKIYVSSIVEKFVLFSLLSYAVLWLLTDGAVLISVLLGIVNGVTLSAFFTIMLTWDAVFHFDRHQSKHPLVRIFNHPRASKIGLWILPAATLVLDIICVLAIGKNIPALCGFGAVILLVLIVAPVAVWLGNKIKAGKGTKNTDASRGKSSKTKSRN